MIDQKQEGKDDKKTHTVETQCGVFVTGVLAADRSLREVVTVAYFSKTCITSAQTDSI